MKMTKDEIRQMFWHEVNGLERPEEVCTKRYALEGLCYENPKEIVYMTVIIDWKKDTGDLGNPSPENWFEPVILSALIMDEMDELILDITSIVK